VVVVLVVVVLGHQGYVRYQASAYRQLCHEQQRKLQQGINGLGVTNLDVELDGLLRRVAGELPIGADVSDPGAGRGTASNYVLMAGSHRLGCVVHGSPFLAQDTTP
jgi:hypothetical protein